MENITNFPTGSCKRCQNGLPSPTFYLLQNIPIFINKTFFKKLDSIILSFIWNYKSRRIKKEHQCKPKVKGGLALPNFTTYYWAACLHSLSFWLDDTSLLSGWLEMEREDSIGAVILSPVVVDKSCYRHNTVIHNIIRIWKQMGKLFNLRKVSFLLPIASNPSFAPPNMDRFLMPGKS